MKKQFVVIGAVGVCLVLSAWLYKIEKQNPVETVSADLSSDSDVSQDSEKNENEESADVNVMSTNVNEDQQFYSEEISDQLFDYIYGNSYKTDCTIPRDELRLVNVLYYGFDGETHDGELIVNEKIAQDIVEIFKELYDNKYPIEKIQLIDAYDSDDEASMEDNNTSAFNYRTISNSDTLSNHSLGLAIDINPLYNPYVKTVNGEVTCEPANGTEYMDRTQEFEHKIDENDLCYQLFIEHGFTWGGSWDYAKDYQHFEKLENE